MALINIHDRADELRIEIRGDFSGPCVRDTSATWRASLPDATHRRLTVDISEVSSCDTEGQELLREMYRHGTQIAATKPAALDLLNKITTPGTGKVVGSPDGIQNRLRMRRSVRVSAASAS
jgi:hypothetical protein